MWMTNGEIARYRAASEGCEVAVRPLDGGWAIELDAALDCPDFTLSLHAPRLAERQIHEVVWQAADEPARVLAYSPEDGRLLPANTWRLAPDGVALCFHLRRGRQVLNVRCSST